MSSTTGARAARPAGAGSSRARYQSITARRSLSTWRTRSMTCWRSSSGSTSRSSWTSATSARASSVVWSARRALSPGSPLPAAASNDSRSAASAVERIRARSSSKGSVSGWAIEAHLERTVLERRAGGTVVGEGGGKEHCALVAVDAHDQLEADLLQGDLAALRQWQVHAPGRPAAAHDEL